MDDEDVVAVAAVGDDIMVVVLLILCVYGFGLFWRAREKKEESSCIIRMQRIVSSPFFSNRRYYLSRKESRKQWQCVFECTQAGATTETTFCYGYAVNSRLFLSTSPVNVLGLKLYLL
jgi:hypothetical protein